MSIRHLEGSLAGRDLVILGNSPTVGRVALGEIGRAGGQAVSLGLNAAPAIARDKGLHLDYHLLFDFRFLDLKGDLLLPHLSESTECIWGEHMVESWRRVPRNRVHTVPFLGYEGFSYWFPAGAFAGHTVAHVALQFAYFARPRSVFMLGVDLTYSAKQPRFYQARRGDDVELQVRGRQLHWLSEGAATLRRAGTRVCVVGGASYLSGYVESISFGSLLSTLAGRTDGATGE